MVIATQTHRARSTNPAARVAARSVPHAHLGRSYPSTESELPDPRNPRLRRLRGHQRGDHQPRRAGHGRRRQGGARGPRPEGIPRRPGQRLAALPHPVRACRRAPFTLALQKLAGAASGRATWYPTTSRPSPSRRQPDGPRHPGGTAPGHQRGGRPHSRCCGPCPYQPARRGRPTVRPGRAGWSGSDGRPAGHRASTRAPRALRAGVLSLRRGRSVPPSSSAPAAGARGGPVDPPRPASTSGTASRVDLTLRNPRAHHHARAPAARSVSGTRGADLLVPPLGRAERTIAATEAADHGRGLVEIGPLQVVVGDPLAPPSAPSRSTEGRADVYPHVDQIDPLPYRATSDSRCGQPLGAGRTGEDLHAVTALRRRRRPAAHPLADLGATRRAPRAPERAPWQGRTTVLLTFARRPTRRLARGGGGVGGGQHRVQLHLVRLVTTAGTHSNFARTGLITSRRSWSTWRSCRRPAALRGRWAPLHRRGAGADRRRRAERRPSGRCTSAAATQHDRAHHAARLGIRGRHRAAAGHPRAPGDVRQPVRHVERHVRSSTRRGRVSVGGALNTCPNLVAGADNRIARAQ